MLPDPVMYYTISVIHYQFIFCIFIDAPVLLSCRELAFRRIHRLPPQDLPVLSGFFQHH